MARREGGGPERVEGMHVPGHVVLAIEKALLTNVTGTMTSGAVSFAYESATKAGATLAATHSLCGKTWIDFRGCSAISSDVQAAPDGPLLTA